MVKVTVYLNISKIKWNFLHKLKINNYIDKKRNLIKENQLNSF